MTAQCFLTIFFIAALFQETEAGGSSVGVKFSLWVAISRIVGSLRKHWFNWKMVSERTVKLWMHDAFLPFFCIADLFQETEAGGSSGGVKFGLWAAISRIVDSLREHWFNWKMVSERTVKLWMHDAFLPFFCIADLFQETEAGGSSGGVKFGLWAAISRIVDSLWEHWFNWKMVSERTVKLWMHDACLPFFCITALFQETEAGGSGVGVKFCLWAAISRIAGSLWKHWFKWKMVRERTVKLWMHDACLPFFSALLRGL